MNEWWLITRKRQRKGEYTGTLDKPRKVGCGNTINTHISVDTTYSFNTGSSYSIALSEGMSQQQADREVQPRPVGPPGVELELLKRAKVKMARVRKTRPTSTKNALSFSTTGTLWKQITNTPTLSPWPHWWHKGWSALLINYLFIAINITWIPVICQTTKMTTMC